MPGSTKGSFLYTVREKAKATHTQRPLCSELAEAETPGNNTNWEPTRPLRTTKGEFPLTLGRLNREIPFSAFFF